MNLQETTLLIGAVAILVALVAMARECLPVQGNKKKRAAWLANGRVGAATGCVTRFAEAALATRYVLVKKGTADDEVLVCGATDRPLGVIQDSAALDEEVSVQLLGGSIGSVPMVASKAIDVNDLVYTAAAGKVTDTSGAGVYCVGVALTAAAADGDVFDVAPIHTHVAQSS